jgi:hypothetical protein
MKLSEIQQEPVSFKLSDLQESKPVKLSGLQNNTFIKTTGDILSSAFSEANRQHPLIAPFLSERIETPQQKLKRLTIEADTAKIETTIPSVAIQTATNIVEYPLQKIGQALRWVTTPVRAGIEKLPLIPEHYRKPISEVVGTLSEYAAYGMLTRGIEYGKTIPGAFKEQGMKNFARDIATARIQSRNPGMNKESAGQLADIMTSGKHGKSLVAQVETMNKTSATKATQDFVDKVWETTKVTSEKILATKIQEPVVTPPTPVAVVPTTIIKPTPSFVPDVVAPKDVNATPAQPAQGETGKITPADINTQSNIALTNIFKKAGATVYEMQSPEFANRPPQAYLTSKTDLELLQKEIPNLSVTVKDVNGQRGRFTIGDYVQLVKHAEFTDRIREVWTLEKPTPTSVDPDFMEGIFKKLKTKLISGTTEESQPQGEVIEPIEGVELNNNSTIKKSQIPLFQNAVKNELVRKTLKELGIKKVVIEPPYKFSLSEQANINIKKGEIRVNADATNPTNSMLHELGHAKFNSLSKEQQNILIERAKTYTNPDVKGYQNIKAWEEIVADSLFNRPDFAPDISKLTPAEGKAIEVKTNDYVQFQTEGGTIKNGDVKIIKGTTYVTPDGGTNPIPLGKGKILKIEQRDGRKFEQTNDVNPKEATPGEAKVRPATTDVNTMGKSSVADEIKKAESLASGNKEIADRLALLKARIKQIRKDEAVRTLIMLDETERKIVIDMRERIDLGEAGKRGKVTLDGMPAGDDEVRIDTQSSFPKWFQNKNLSKPKMLSILDRAISGKGVTVVERRMFDSIYPEAAAEWKLREERYARELEAENAKARSNGVTEEGIAEENRIAESEFKSEIAEDETGDVSFNTKDFEKPLQETNVTGEKQNLIPGTETTLPPTKLKPKVNQDQDALKDLKPQGPKDVQGEMHLTPPPPSGTEKTGREGNINPNLLNPARWDRVREWLEDNMISVRRLIEQTGTIVTEENNPYEAEKRFAGRIGARAEEANSIVIEIDKDIISTAKKLNIPDNLLSNEVNRFLIARHAPERNAKHGDKAAGITDKEAFTVRAEIAGKPYAKEVERIADIIQAFNNKTLDTLLEGEVISQELYDKLRTMYKNHVPLQRVMSEEDDIVDILTKKGFDVQGAGLKRAKGSDLEVADILTNVVANYKAAISRAEKNIVDNYTLRFARENNYFDGLFEEIQLPMLPVGKIQHRAAVDSGYLAQVRKFAESLGAKVVTGGQPGRTLGTYGGKIVERKFATPEEVVSHEVGHFLDDKYKLKQQFYKKGDTKKVGEEIYKFMVDQGQSANRVKKVSERFAHAFEWWLSNRALAKEDLPLFTKAIEEIISGIPELSPLLKIRPTPGLTVESIEEMVFARQKYNTDPKVLPVREKGKQLYLKINDAQLAMALRGVNKQKVEGLLKGVQVFTRMYSMLATRFNPEFSFPNMIRDLQEVVVYLMSKEEIGLKGAVKTVSKEVESVKDIIDSIRGANTPGARLYKQLKMDGGTTGGMALSTRGQIELDVEKIRLINRSTSRKAVQILLQSIDNWNTVFEDATRLSVYKQALAQGLSRNKAAGLAKEASVNFNKMGTASPAINAAYMFSNASIQGSVKTIHALRNPKTAAIVLTLLGGAVLLMAEYNDKKDKDWRKKVTKYDRLNGIPIVLSSEGDKNFRYITFPTSWALKPIKVFFDTIGDIQHGEKTAPAEAVSKLLGSFIESYNPIGGNDFVSAIVPTILDLPVDIARNRSFTGGYIRPEWNNSAPASIKYFDSLRKKLTGRVFIGLTKGWGEEGIEVSPADINYAYENIIGGAGRFVTKALNTIVGVSQGKVQAKEIPFISRFYRDVPVEEIRESGQEFNEIKKILGKQDKNRFYFNQEAELAWDGMKQLPLRADRERHYANIQATNPALAEKIKTIIEEEQANLSYTDRLIKNLGVENGARAKYLWDKIQQFEMRADREKFYADMQKKKIITADVDKQIRKLIKK